MEEAILHMGDIGSDQIPRAAEKGGSFFPFSFFSARVQPTPDVGTSLSRDATIYMIECKSVGVLIKRRAREMSTFSSFKIRKSKKSKKEMRKHKGCRRNMLE